MCRSLLVPETMPGPQYKLTQGGRRDWWNRGWWNQGEGPAGLHAELAGLCGELYIQVMMVLRSKNSLVRVKGLERMQPWDWGKWLGFSGPEAVLQMCTDS